MNDSNMHVVVDENYDGILSLSKAQLVKIILKVLI